MKYKVINLKIVSLFASIIFLANLALAQTTENNNKSLAQNTRTGEYCCIKNDNNNCTDVPDCIKKTEEEEESIG